MSESSLLQAAKTRAVKESSEVDIVAEFVSAAMSDDEFESPHNYARAILAALDKHRSVRQADELRRIGNVSPEDRAPRMARGLIGLGLPPGRERQELSRRMSWLATAIHDDYKKRW